MADPMGCAPMCVSSASTSGRPPRPPPWATIHLLAHRKQWQGRASATARILSRATSTCRIGPCGARGLTASASRWGGGKFKIFTQGGAGRRKNGRGGGECGLGGGGGGGSTLLCDVGG